MTIKSDDHQNHQEHPISKRSRARFPPGPLQCCCACGLWAVGCWLAVVAAVAVVAVVAGVALVAVVVAVVVAAVAAAVAAAFGGASGHAAGNGGSSSGAGAIKWCCCQCISAIGAGGAAGVGADVVL